jgi:hypothetical protein
MSRPQRFLLAASLAGALGAASVGSSLPPPSSKDVDISVSSGANPKISLSQDPVHPRKNQHFVKWKLASNPRYDFDIYVTGPGPNSPRKPLPDPTCSGSGNGRTCKSIVPDSDDYLGDHKYKIVVHTPGNDTELDPQVTVDP